MKKNQIKLMEDHAILHLYSIKHGWKKCLIDIEDIPKIEGYLWYYIDTKTSSRVQSGIKKVNGIRTSQLLHRLVLNAPKGVLVDHINHDTLDNRKENLRLCNYSQNAFNMQSKGGASRFKGVYYNKRQNSWFSQIQCNGKFHFLGYHDTEEECARAYDIKARELFGNFAYTNFEEGE